MVRRIDPGYPLLEAIITKIDTLETLSKRAVNQLNFYGPLVPAADN